MQLHYKLRNFLSALIILFMAAFLTLQALPVVEAVFAATAETATAETTTDTNKTTEATQTPEHFVTIYDLDATLTVKTSAATVAEVLERAQITLDSSDRVEPALDTALTGENFYINIYRAHPAIVIDGQVRQYVMTASYDPKQVARDAGFTVYDGDEVTQEPNASFLEAGVAAVYRLVRNGGRTITVETSIPYTTETRPDYTLKKGETRLEQPGEDGRQTTVYEVQFENGVEASRTLVSETVTLEPVPEIVLVGAQPSISPAQEQCAAWAREAGVSEADLPAAIDLIYRESGCRVDATNAYSGAYGIPQALPGDKMAAAGSDWHDNPVTQIRWMIDYVNTRYGGWAEALNFWHCIGTCYNRYGAVQKVSTWY